MLISLLNLQDRLPWLNTLHELISSWCSGSVCDPSPQNDRERSSENVVGVLACSALKRSYRDILSGRSAGGLGGVVPNKGPVVIKCVFVLLKTSEQVLTQRMSSRKGHFMPASLVRSQLDILELPDGQERAVVIETDGLGVDDILMRIIDELKHMNIE